MTTNNRSRPRLPGPHLFAAALVSLVLAGLLLIPSEPVSAAREVPYSPTPQRDSSFAQALDEAIADLSRRQPERPLQLDAQVQPGDSLSAILVRLGIGAGEAYALMEARGPTEVLRRLAPGERISVLLGADGALVELVYERSKLEAYRFFREEDGFRGERLARAAERAIALRAGTIRQSLFVDGARAGLSAAQILELANIFAWDVDFALDVRAGDRFSVLLEEHFVDGEKAGPATILAAEFVNRGRHYRAVRHETQDGQVDYYDPQGRPMRKAFLRAPLDFTRVSSNFDPNRLHPIFKTRRPHRGVDYAAPAGTPVYAAGAGKVVASGYSRGNGNYVVIRHGRAYTTKYLHLQKRLVRTGENVRQRQVIGTVGSTGYATGPHLHYEFLIDGRHVDPRTVRLPQAEPLAGAELARFRRLALPLLAQLEALEQTRLAARAP
ncbi:MAG: hypothetical protein KatS3mg124_1980 [Porticoccaceae bacterium]|nr:MAG: hypothetical protein KatS3mg124_1980 [Porticoccaceae bacterium]